MTTPARFRRLRSVLERRQPDLTVLMEKVHKPHNFSAVLRSCDAAGVFEAHMVPADDVAAGIRHGISAGTRRWVRVRRHACIHAAADHLRGEGFRLVAAHPAGAASGVREIDYTRPTAVVIGTELHGLGRQALELADETVRIPMMGMVRSLNVSVAAALVLYEARRQRAEAGMYDSPRLDAATFHHTLFEWAYPRIARRCREEGVPYPELGPGGEIRGEVPR